MESMEKKPFKNKRSIKEHDLPYKEKFETLNEKYTTIKDILKQVLKELNEEKEKKQLLIQEHQSLVLEVKEKDSLIERMQSVSEAVIEEYSVLRVKCDLEVEAATNASKRATKYYQENQKLKGSSQPELLNALISESNELPCQDSSLEESTSELDMINNVASELRTEIASLKVQLMKEIEKQNSIKEDFEIVKDLYEQEVKEHKFTKENILSLQTDQSHMETLLEQEKSGNIVEQLESNNEKQENISKDCLNTAEDSDAFVKKLKLAEEQINSFKTQNNAFNRRIQELEFENRKLRAEASASNSLPIPPPPPPPLPPPSFNPIKSLITFINSGKKSAKIKKENSETQHQKAMSEMIDAIKKGQVQLKPTPKTFPQSHGKDESALVEMKSILCTLKKKDTMSTEVIKEDVPQALQSSKLLNECSAEVCTNFNIGSDVDEELKVLLRKRSLKSIESQNSCVMSMEEIKSNSSSYVSSEGQSKSQSFTLPESVVTSENNNDLLKNQESFKNLEDRHVSLITDSDSCENQNFETIQMPENVISNDSEIQL